mgnify:CR=1 FL=1
MIVAEENKKRTAVWLTPGVIRRMDGWLEEDNCKTRSEFIEKALRFYMGYLAAEDTSPAPWWTPCGVHWQTTKIGCALCCSSSAWR